MITHQVKTICIQFANPIQRKELPAFRGAIISSLDHDNILYHNHDGDRFRYAYPLIQYKRLHKKAAILCIGEGTEAIADFFTSAHFDICLNGKAETLRIEDIQARQTLVQCWQDPINYTLRGWLPLNEENYALYMATEALTGKVSMLENILVGNILSALKGLGIIIEDRITCSIQEMSEPRLITFKGIKLMMIDVSFSSNISLPDFIGLGKHASIGFGTVKRIKNNQIK